MNKRLLTLSMVGLLTVTLASCSGVKGKTVDGKQVIVTIKDTNYTADDLLAKYGTTADGVKSYYNAIYDVLIRHNQKDKITEEIKTNVNNSLDKFTRDVKANASSNGKTYKAELSDELKEKGVESLAELKELFTLDEQKSKYEDDWYSTRIDYVGTKDEHKDALTQKYIKESAPYHIKHILVKTDSSDSSLYDGKITEAEALKLTSVVERLAANNETFGQISQQASDDTGSAAEYGSIGILDQGSKSGFINEFKYGCYAYDAFLDTHGDDGSVVATGSTRAQALNIPETISYKSVSKGTTTTINVKDALTSIGEIPYQAIEDLKNYADKIKTENNLTYVPNAGESVWGGSDPASVSERAGLTINESYYPRNVIYNNYFNDHGLFVITDDGFTGDDARFHSIPSLSTTHKVLCDEDGNPILATRGGSGDSYQGVFFMVIEQSPFWYDTETLEYTELKGSTPSTLDYLRYYYSTNIPSTSSEDVSSNRKYATFITATRQKYEERAGDIKKAVKGYNPSISYDIWDSLLADAKASGVKIDDAILTSIENMIAVERDANTYSKEQSNASSWKSYIETLSLQDSEKEVKQISLDYIKMYDSNYTPTSVK